MQPVLIVLYLTAMSVLNRARGNGLYETPTLTGGTSTTLTRLVATLGMAVATSIWYVGDAHLMLEVGSFLWAALYIWCIKGWDNYWGAAIGSFYNPNKAVFWPSDTLARLIPWFKPLYTAPAIGSTRARIWGLFTMGIRMVMAAPAIAGLAFITGHTAIYALATPLLALPYLIWGYIVGGQAVKYAEYTVGAMLGGLFYLTIWI